MKCSIAVDILVTISSVLSEDPVVSVFVFSQCLLAIVKWIKENKLELDP